MVQAMVRAQYEGQSTGRAFAGRNAAPEQHGLPVQRVGCLRWLTVSRLGPGGMRAMLEGAHLQDKQCAGGVNGPLDIQGRPVMIFQLTPVTC